MHNVTLHKNFTEDEFRCRCGCGLGYKDMQESTLLKLFEARDEAGVPFIITSAIRCENHNRNVGGAPNSAHLRGYAIDVRYRNGSEGKRVLDALAKRFPRMGINMERVFFHADDDPSLPTPALFSY